MSGRAKTFQCFSPAPVNCETEADRGGQIKAAFPGRAQLELVRFEVLCGLAKFLILCCFETAAVHSGKGHWTPQATPEMQEMAGFVRRVSQDIRAKRGQAGPGHTSNSRVAPAARGVDACKNCNLPEGKRQRYGSGELSRCRVGSSTRLTGKTNPRVPPHEERATLGTPPGACAHSIGRLSLPLQASHLTIKVSEKPAAQAG